MEEPKETEQSTCPETSLQCKVLVCMVSLTLAFALCFGIYFVATSPDRQECLRCPLVDMESIIVPAFVVYSTWTLFTTCITWGLYVQRRFFSSSVQPECLLPSMHRVSLPLSVAVALGYTFYFASSDLSRDFMDEDHCYTVPVFGSSIPREETSLGDAVAFLVLDCFTNATLHYVSAAINLTLYFKHFRRDTWKPLLPFAFMIFESILIIAVHLFVEPVYCSKNIFLTCLWMNILFAALHFVFFRKRYVFPPIHTERDSMVDESPSFIQI